MKSKIVAFSLVPMLLTGCNNSSGYNENLDPMFARNELTNRSGEFTDFVTTHGEIGEQMQASYTNNYINVTDKARTAISDTKLYENANIQVDGNHLKVIAYYRENLTAAAQAEAEEDLRSHLFAALPDYTFEITIVENGE
jgi:hypothetical protein